MEIDNSVFMQYCKTDDGFVLLPKQNVDYGGGLERIAAAAIESPMCTASASCGRSSKRSRSSRA